MVNELNHLNSSFLAISLKKSLTFAYPIPTNFIQMKFFGFAISAKHDPSIHLS